MYKLVLHFLLALTSESFDILETLDLLSPPILKTSPKKLDLTGAGFSNLFNYHVGAKPAAESKYPWIARVIHSRSADVPYMCTAVCIEEAIFITAARCIYTLKVRYTTIMYMSKRFEARVFVVPSKPTRQMFDDIGIIVVDTNKVKIKKWEVIKLLNVVNRTDEAFQWFAELNKNGNIKYKVLGYTVEKGFHEVRTPNNKYHLTELDVVASLDICFEVLEQYRHGKGFRFPCYYSCNFAEFNNKNEKCRQYHGVEGGAVVDRTSNKLIGIATWGTMFHKKDLPVGFSTVNSENFFKDLTCAKRIRKDNGMLVKKGYYQSLCDRN